MYSSFVVSYKETTSLESTCVRAINLLLFRPGTHPFQRTSVKIINVKSRICRFVLFFNSAFSHGSISVDTKSEMFAELRRGESSNLVMIHWCSHPKVRTSDSWWEFLFALKLFCLGRLNNRLILDSWINTCKLQCSHWNGFVKRRLLMHESRTRS